jgi:acyl-CoA reductase-like NAD-dependent aldehyde dehydrogenase
MDALNITNDSQYGLGASMWTEDLDKAGKFSKTAQPGVSVINIVASDPRVPFGGITMSGFGRVILVRCAGIC